MKGIDQTISVVKNDPEFIASLTPIYNAIYETIYVILDIIEHKDIPIIYKNQITILT